MMEKTDSQRMGVLGGDTRWQNKPFRRRDISSPVGGSVSLDKVVFRERWLSRIGTGERWLMYCQNWSRLRPEKRENLVIFLSVDGKHAS